MLSKNPNITWEIVQRHPEKKWNLDFLSSNPTITWDIVQANPAPLGQEWNFRWLSSHPNITWEIIQDNPDMDWDTDEISENPNVTWDIVQANPDFPWQFHRLSLHLSTIPEIFKSNPLPLGQKWNYKWLSSNPHLTWEFIQENKEQKWDCYALSKNQFHHHSRYAYTYQKEMVDLLENHVVRDVAFFVFQIGNNTKNVLK